MKKLVEFIKKIQTDERFSAFDEAAIKQGVVLKVLSLLDWDPFDVMRCNLNTKFRAAGLIFPEERKDQ